MKSDIIKLIVLSTLMLLSSCSSENKVTYSYAKAEKQDISTSITATGTIEPVTKVEVGTQVSGIISKIYVDYNSYVHKGDIMAELDRTNLNSELVSAESNLSSAVSNQTYQNKSIDAASKNLDVTLKNLDLSNQDLELSRKNLDLAKNNVEYSKKDLSIAESNMNRYSTLFQKGLISANDYEQAQQTLNNAKQCYNNAIQSLNQAQSSYNSSKTSNNQAQESVTQARLQYDQSVSEAAQAGNQVEVQKQNVSKAHTNLGYATITAPIDGIVLSKEVEEGQTVAAAMTTPTLFILAQDLTDMRVIADVDEADIGGVKEGQRVTFTVDAFPDDVFQGAVTQVRQEATTESNVVTYEVVISAPNDDLKLKPGLTANVTIYTMEQYDILSVPSKALRFSPNETLLLDGESIEDCDGEKKVWKHEGNVFKAYAVETGVTNGAFTEIKSGLREGDEVITEFNLLQEEAEGQQGDNNPFMPKRPGSNKQKKGEGTSSNGSSGGSGQGGPGGQGGNTKPSGSK